MVVLVRVPDRIRDFRPYLGQGTDPDHSLLELKEALATVFDHILQVLKVGRERVFDRNLQALKEDQAKVVCHNQELKDFDRNLLDQDLHTDRVDPSDHSHSRYHNHIQVAAALALVTIHWPSCQHQQLKPWVP